MSNKIITISREFGSGGRLIGKKLAEEMDVPYYGHIAAARVRQVDAADQRVVVRTTDRKSVV